MIYYLNDMPFSLAFGGKEMQLETYFSIINNFENSKIQKLNFWEKNSVSNNSIFHLFGSAKWYHSVVSQIKANFNPHKIIINPNFYFLPSLKLKASSKIVKFLPYKSDFYFKEFVFKNADLLITNSIAEKELICSLFGKDLASKIETIYNVIPDNFREIQKEIDIEKYFNIKKKYILSVGLLDERKNSINMIKAFLNTQHQHDNILVIVGKFRFTNPVNYKIAEQLIKSNTKRIIHITNISPNSNELKSLYKNCDLHFLPSHVETPGISNIEALSFGKKILVGDCPPVAEYFKNYAFYCNSYSLQSVSKSLEIAISEDTPQGNSLFSENYMVSSIKEKVKKIYEN